MTTFTRRRTRYIALCATVLIAGGIATPSCQADPWDVEKSTTLGIEAPILDSATPSEPLELKGTITELVVTAPGENVAQLVEAACERTALTQQIRRKDTRLKGTRGKAWALTKDMAQWATSNKGFEESSEAADVVLEEKLKLKSAAAIDYAKQKQEDEMHMKVMSSLMQIAMGLGTPNQAKGQKSIDFGQKNLAKLVGNEEAEKATASLRTWASTVKVSDEIFERETSDILEMQERSRTVVTKKLDNDEVIKEIQKRLHKYNKRSNVMRITAKVVNTTLSIAAFSPTIAAPAAQLGQMAFIMATGGPEEAKILKSLYLDKRLVSRVNTATAEASMAVNNHNLAIVTRNPVLLKFSESIIGDMAGKEQVASILYATESAGTAEQPTAIKEVSSDSADVPTINNDVESDKAAEEKAVSEPTKAEKQSDRKKAVKKLSENKRAKKSRSKDKDATADAAKDATTDGDSQPADDKDSKVENSDKLSYSDNEPMI